MHCVKFRVLHEVQVPSHLASEETVVCGGLAVGQDLLDTI